MQPGEADRAHIPNPPFLLGPADTGAEAAGLYLATTDRDSILLGGQSEVRAIIGNCNPAHREVLCEAMRLATVNRHPDYTAILVLVPHGPN